MIIKTASMDDLLKLKKNLESINETEPSALPCNEEVDNKPLNSIELLLEKVKALH